MCFSEGIGNGPAVATTFNFDNHDEITVSQLWDNLKENLIYLIIWIYKPESVKQAIFFFFYLSGSAGECGDEVFLVRGDM